ncbi:aspartyl-phosphate phosphatase Spo0E family protein [Paenibacillus massiliensis]|uniref:aspartyl-phosphate phosphatase Spo0E family protein n=1 Tax=Paenibacillus massiliensis TaxID=225917 RepID=UPI000365ACF4|nr:aspartyl-phosphate phosphatase Spo0E family protein [Paenibacillus massiliensis]
MPSKMFFARIRIERERIKLHKMTAQHSIHHPKVIAQSVKLDELMNYYQKLGDGTRRIKSIV